MSRQYVVSLGLTTVLVAVFGTPAEAAAQDSTARTSAVQLFDEGTKLMAAGDVRAACPKFAASVELDPQLGALLHLADCYAKNGQIASAWSAFRDAEEMATLRGDERASLAREQVSALEPRLSRVTVIVADPDKVEGLEVRFDGALVAPGAWGVATPIDSGAHTVEARAPGHDTWTSQLEVKGDAERLTVEVPTLTRVTQVEAASPAPTPAPMHVRMDDPGSTIRAVGWAGAGVGLVSLGIGAVFEYQKFNKLTERNKVCPTRVDCSDAQEQRLASLTSDARTADVVAKVGFVAGGVFLASGIAAILLAPKPKAHAETAWVLPALAPNAVALSFGATWQ
jgi:hypothetical protein